MEINWLWLVVGLMPYSIKRQNTKNEQVLYIRALIWRLAIRWQEERCSWEVSFPWIRRYGNN